MNIDFNLCLFQNKNYPWKKLINLLVSQNPLALDLYNCTFFFNFWISLGHKYTSVVELEQVQQKKVLNSRQRLLENVAKADLQIRDTPADGNCFYHAVADQLCLLGCPPQTAVQLRRNVVAYMHSHPELEVMQLIMLIALFGKCFYPKLNLGIFFIYVYRPSLNPHLPKNPTETLNSTIKWLQLIVGSSFPVILAQKVLLPYPEVVGVW